MSGQNKGFLLGLAVAAVIGAVAVIGVVIASGGGDEGPKTVLAQTPAPSVTPPPTSAPATSTAVPPTQAPAPTQPPPPPPPPTEPPIRTCAEIRASGTYNSEAERQFFLASCQQTAAPPTAPGPSQAAPSQPQAPGLTEEEQTYIRRASQVNLQYVARLTQYWQTPSFGALADLYELASIALNHANALNGIQPVPARFQTVHRNLVGSLLAFRDHILTINNVTTLPAFLTWLATYERLADNLDGALVTWQVVVGVQTTPLGGLR